MDQSTRPSASSDPAIQAILERAAELHGEDLVALARAYEATGRDDDVDRRRVIDVASRRAQRDVDIDAAERAVSEALARATAGRERRALLRLGILQVAEQAVLDAVLAEVLRDRLGSDIATKLAQPFETVR
jgi:hypothetical protein